MNSVQKVIKFLSIFVVLFFIVLIYEIEINTDNTSNILSSFENGTTQSICNEDIYLKCYQKKIGSIFESATPFMIYHILQANDKSLERDLLRDGHTREIYYNYLKNINLIYDKLRVFELDNNSLQFFQILAIPVVKFYIKLKFDQDKNMILNFTKKNNITDDFFLIELKKLQQIDIR